MKLILCLIFVLAVASNYYGTYFRVNCEMNDLKDTKINKSSDSDEKLNESNIRIISNKVIYEDEKKNLRRKEGNSSNNHGGNSYKVPTTHFIDDEMIKNKEYKKENQHDLDKSLSFGYNVKKRTKRDNEMLSTDVNAGINNTNKTGEDYNEHGTNAQDTITKNINSQNVVYYPNRGTNETNAKEFDNSQNDIVKLTARYYSINQDKEEDKLDTKDDYDNTTGNTAGVVAENYDNDNASGVVAEGYDNGNADGAGAGFTTGVVAESYDNGSADGAGSGSEPGPGSRSYYDGNAGKAEPGSISYYDDNAGTGESGSGPEPGPGSIIYYGGNAAGVVTENYDNGSADGAGFEAGVVTENYDNGNAAGSGSGPEPGPGSIIYYGGNAAGVVTENYDNGNAAGSGSEPGSEPGPGSRSYYDGNAGGAGAGVAASCNDNSASNPGEAEAVNCYYKDDKKEDIYQNSDVGHKPANKLDETKSTDTYIPKNGGAHKYKENDIKICLTLPALPEDSVKFLVYLHMNIGYLKNKLLCSDNKTN
ncbi:hypothetical protein PRELSG_0729200 [Plasmodium relictum]|uniref:Rhoptry neck protein 2 n=1 Tax=Plasmodium relictum TaxID=85471 RepID=A0A1J1H3Q1_PLARL|nr:hypothetical protein PRELSG_0729200 [Plasmodium relictum]CRG99527.1 hypothetical protein PRELSG_0729200 [Plasmodium relictum]